MDQYSLLPPRFQKLFSKLEVGWFFTGLCLSEACLKLQLDDLKVQKTTLNLLKKKLQAYLE